MSGKIANPGPLGLAAFGLTTLILNFVNAEIIPAESIGIGFTYGLILWWCMPNICRHVGNE